LVLELKENIAKVGADLKERLVRSLKSTWTSINSFAQAHRGGPVNTEVEIDEQVTKAIQEAQQQQLDTSTDMECKSLTDNNNNNWVWRSYLSS